MEKKQAINEIHEIKQVMEESQRRTNRGKYWVALAMALLALIVSGLIPYLGPVFGIWLVVGGILAWRRSYDSTTKAISGTIIALGATLILATLLVIFGLMSFITSTGSMISSSGPLP